METIKLQIITETASEKEIQLPAFFNCNEILVGVYSTKKALRVTLGLLGINECTPENWIDEKSFQITEQEFEKIYNEVLEKLSLPKLEPTND